MKTILLLKYAPLFLFILCARYKGLTDLAWRDAFIVGGIASVVVVAIQLYKKEIIDRCMLGINLFLILGAVGFLCDISLLLYYYSAYKGVSLLSCIAVVGLLTTLFSPAGFIGIEITKKRLIYDASFQLLLVNILAIVWSFIMNSEGLFLAVVVPYLVVCVMYERIGRDISAR